MASPSTIRKETLAALRSTRRDMSSAGWLMAVAKQPLEVRREAALARLDLEQAILAIGNGKLADIGAKLRENEGGLRAGRAELVNARKRLDRVDEVLGAIGRVLDVLARVIRFPISR